MNKSILETVVYNKAIELAERWKMLGKWEDAINLLNGIIPVAKNIDHEAQANVWLQIGRTLTDQALFGGKENSDKRKNALEKAQELAEKSGSKALLGDVYDAMGFSLHAAYLESDRSKEPEQEMDFFKLGLDLRKEHGSSSHIAESVFHIGLVHDVVRQEYDKALPYHQEAYKLAMEADEKLTMSYAIRHIGFTKLANEDIAGATEAFTESLELRQSIRFVPGVAFALATLARVSKMSGDIIQALNQFKEARDLLLLLGAEPQVAWINSHIAEIELL